MASAALGTITGDDEMKFFGLLLVVTAVLARAQSLQAVPGSTVRDSLAPGESKRWLLKVALDSYTKVTLAGENATLKTTLRDEAGKLIATCSSVGGSGGTALFAWVSKAEETYTVEAALSATEGPARNIAVTVQEARPAIPGDTDRQEPLLEIAKLLADSQKLVSARQYTRAIPLLERARDQGRLANDTRVEAAALYRLGMAHYYLDERQPALDLLQQALALQRAERQSFETALTLNNRAAVDRLAGYCRRSLDEVKEALQIRESLGDRRGIAYTLLGLAASYYCLGDSQAALETDLRVLDKWRELKDTANEAEAQNTLGVIYIALGEWDQAKESLQASLALWRASANAKGEGEANYNLGLLRMSLGDATGALNFYNKASALMSAAKDNRGMAYVVEGIGEALSNAGNHAAGMAQLRQAQSMLEQLGERYEEAYVWQSLGSELARSGSLSDSRSAYERALAMELEIGDQHGQTISLYRLAQLAGRGGDNSSAGEYIDRAITLVENTRGSVLDAAHRASYLASKRGLYEFKTSLLMRAHRTVEAFETSEAAHARTLLDEVGGASGLDGKLIAAEQSLAEELRIHTTPVLLARKQTLEADIRQSSPSQAAFELPTISGAGQIQSSLTTDDVLLEYLTGEEASYGWAITRNQVWGFQLPGRGVLERAVRLLTVSITARLEHPFTENLDERAARLARASHTVQSAAAKLSDQLLEPIPRSLRKRRMIFVTDGPLARVPFALLPLAAGKEIVETPSASVLITKRVSGNKKSLEPVLIVADPKVHASGFSPLAFSKQEGSDLSAMAAPAAVEFRRGQNANRAMFTQESIRQFGLIHISSHAVVNEKHPDQSAILLSDGWLTAASIRKIPLTAALVTLSACDTAAGKDVSGDGLMSLQRSFLYSGAHAVLSALWAVDDQATAEFMHLFYSGLLRSQLSMSAALKRAQQVMRSGKSWRDPYYWAAFTIQGDWQ